MDNKGGGRLLFKGTASQEYTEPGGERKGMLAIGSTSS